MAVTEIELARKDEVDSKAADPHGNEAHSSTFAVDGDSQPAEAHNLGGTEHNADTLANLNAKVSDATLDDSGDSRPPDSHGNAAHSTTFLPQADYNPEADTHSKYTDSEAITAVDGEVSAAASTVSGLDSAVNSHESDTGNPHNVGLNQAVNQNDTIQSPFTFSPDGAGFEFTSNVGSEGGSPVYQNAQIAPVEAGSPITSDSFEYDFQQDRWEFNANVSMGGDNIRTVGTFDANIGEFTDELVTREVSAQGDIASGDVGLVVVTGDDRVLYRYETS